MDFFYLFTSLQGRINRAKWWAGEGIPLPHLFHHRVDRQPDDSRSDYFCQSLLFVTTLSIIGCRRVSD
jgi:hypothetical protein